MSNGCSGARTVYVNNRPILIGAGNPTILIENVPLCAYEAVIGQEALEGLDSIQNTSLHNRLGEGWTNLEPGYYPSDANQSTLS